MSIRGRFSASDIPASAAGSSGVFGWWSGTLGYRLHRGHDVGDKISYPLSHPPWLLGVYTSADGRREGLYVTVVTVYSTTDDTSRKNKSREIHSKSSPCPCPGDVG